MGSYTSDKKSEIALMLSGNFHRLYYTFHRVY